MHGERAQFWFSHIEMPVSRVYSKHSIRRTGVIHTLSATNI